MTGVQTCALPIYGTYESVASNYLFDPITTRSIHVDSRYMLWNMAEVDGAINLLQEMSIPDSLPGASVSPVSPRKATGTSTAGR